MTIARTGSRGAFIGLMALGLAMLILLKNVSLDKRVAFVAVTLLAVALAAPRGYWDHMLTVFSPKEDYNWSSPTGRRQVFLRGIGYMMRNPLTGIGVGNFERAEGLISDRAAARRDDPTLAGLKWSAAHNSFLEAAAEMGIPGAILFLTLVFGGIVHVLRVRRKIPDAWATGPPEEKFLYYTAVYLPVALFGFAATGFFVSFAYLDPIYVLAAYMAGLDISIEAKLSEPDQPLGEAIAPPQRRYRGGLPPHPTGTLPAPPPPRI